MPGLARSLANRAVHLRITPRPSSLGESREILRLISRFGEVEYFRNLKYDALPAPNAALVIFKDEAAATYCMQKSPIRFRMGRALLTDEVSGDDHESHSQGGPSSQSPPSFPPTSAKVPNASERAAPPTRGPTGAPFGLGSISSAPKPSQQRSMTTTAMALPRPTPKPAPLPFTPIAPPVLDSRLFQIQVNPARTRWRDQIDAGYYYGHFPTSTSSQAHQDLIQRVPVESYSNIDWRKQPRPWRMLRKEMAVGRAKYKPLREIWEAGKHERERKETP